MAARWLFGVGLLIVLGAGPSTEGSESELAEYEAARTSVGRDASAQVKLALWCEAHGLQAERIKHLAIAVLTDPKNATARGLLGLVEFGGHWRRPDAVTEKVKADEALTAKLVEYNARRSRMDNTAEAHWKMAVWCEEIGLAGEARAHFSAVTRLDPSREAAWKRLGCKHVGHRWVSDEQLAAERADASAQKKADQHWKPLLTKWQGWLRQKDKANRDKAEELLVTVSDPRAVPSVWAVFGTGDQPSQETAVRVLGQIDTGGASRALASLSVSGKSAEVRRKAAETLRRRDPRDFLGLLIGMIRDPLKYEVRPVNGAGSPGVLFVEGERYNVRRVYGLTDVQIARLQLTPRIFDPSVPFNPFGYETYSTAMAPDMLQVPNGKGGTISAPNLTVLAARRDLQIGREMIAREAAINVSQEQLNTDVGAIESFNAGATAVNSRVLPILSTLTGQDPSGSSESWNRWWADEQGYAVDSEPTKYKPTLTQFVVNPAIQSHHSCFAAGVPVRTLDGPRPIESIRVGDLVLSQDTTTGRLSFVPVLAIFHNKPAATLKVSMGAESVVATGIHRFWKAGHGWTMTRDLKPGDTLRTIDGTVRVGSVETQAVQPVFNLEVGANQSYFVGGLGVLVHDNSLVKPVPLPFDAAPTLAALTATGH